MVVAFIALGSNLEQPAMQVIQALKAIDAIPAIRILKQSSLYRSTPVGYDDQPDFINAVAEIETTLPALDLLHALQAIETSHGRERTFRNAPRVLDLDLLLYDDTVMQSAELTIPHPRMHERAFVLLPLVEIAPKLLIPGHGKAAALVSATLGQGIEKINSLEK